MNSARAAARALACACALAAAGCASDETPWYARTELPSEGQREVIARGYLERARDLEARGDGERARMTVERGLRFEPENVGLLRLHARLLESAGEQAEARALQARADALDPPPPPPETAPLASGEGRLVVLLPPPVLPEADRNRVPREWPRGTVAAALERRLGERLPGVAIVHAAPASIADARALLRAQGRPSVATLQLERAYFGSTSKDGSFAVAWLRAAAAAPQPDARLVKRSISALRDRAVDLRARAVERVLDDAFESPPLRAWLSSETRVDPGGGAWPREALRAFFPDIERTQQAEVERARAALRGGALAEAAAGLRAAAAIDPGDLDTRSLLDDVETTLALSAALDRRSGREPAGELPLQLSEAERARLEARLAEERTRRDALVGNLSTLAGDFDPPSPEALLALRDVPLPLLASLGTPGASLAGTIGQVVRAASLLTPDGALLARFYFGLEDEASAGRAEGAARGLDALLLREEDNDADGRADRWVGFGGGVATHLWLDRRGTGQPDVHWQYRGPKREPVSIDVDRDHDGRVERRFEYREGRLHRQLRDRDEDGRFDVFETLDKTGAVVRRDEDVDGDAQIDLRSFYRDGRLQRREILDPAALEAVRPTR